MVDRAFVVMDRLPGTTLNELTYRRPNVLEDNKITISYQLGMHMAFAYVFGSKDGYQTNYVFDPESKILTRIDKESFLEVPEDVRTTLAEGDAYTQEIAACELSNLKYIPSFRRKETRPQIIYAFKQGFHDKYAHLKDKKGELLAMVQQARAAWLDVAAVEDVSEYHEDTKYVKAAVDYLIDQNPQEVLKRLMNAKVEVDKGQYKKK